LIFGVSGDGQFGYGGRCLAKKYHGVGMVAGFGAHIPSMQFELYDPLPCDKLQTTATTGQS
jgi:hypothetical protein